MIEQQSQHPVHGDVINLLDYWHVVYKRKILIGAISLSFMLCTLFFCILSPKIYESTASILSPVSTSGMGSLMSNFGGVTSLAQSAGISVPSTTQDRDIYISILKSRIVQESIVNQFKLKNYYKKYYFKRLYFIEDALKYLQNVTTIDDGNEGAILITIEDKNPQMAANIANAYVDYLDRLLAQIGTGAAGRQRRFIAEQLSKTETNLKTAEEAIKQFQEQHRTVALDEQAKGAIEAGATLKGEIMASEVELQVLQNFAKDSHPEVVKLKRKIDELKRQLAKSQYSTGLDLPSDKNNPKHYQKEIYLPVVNVPQVGLELARLTRDVKLQETLYTFLIQQLEQAKIAEVKDTPSVQILDRAVPAEKKSRPKTLLYLAVAGFLGILISIFTAFVLEYINNLRSRAINQ